MEAQAALVRAEGAVELDAEAAIDLDTAGVVLPGNAEHDLAVWLADPFDDPRLGPVRGAFRGPARAIQATSRTAW